MSVHYIIGENLILTDEEIEEVVARRKQKQALKQLTENLVVKPTICAHEYIFSGNIYGNLIHTCVKCGSRRYTSK